MKPMERILKCLSCGEQAHEVKFFDGSVGKPCFIIRPYRKSKCRFWKRGGGGCCKTVSYGTHDKAITEWNSHNNP